MGKQLGPSGVRAMMGYTAYCGPCGWWGSDWVSMASDPKRLKQHRENAAEEWIIHLGSLGHARQKDKP